MRENVFKRQQTQNISPTVFRGNTQVDEQGRDGTGDSAHLFGENTRVHHVCPAGLLPVYAVANHIVDHRRGVGEAVADFGAEAAAGQCGRS